MAALVNFVPLLETQTRGHPLSRQRGIGDKAQEFPGEGIDRRQNAETAAVGERVGDEVERPALVGGAMGALVPRARFRPPRLRTVSRSSRYSRSSFLWFMAIPSLASSRPSRL